MKLNNYTLELKSCGNSQGYAGFMTIFGSSARIGNTDSIPSLSTLIMLEQEDLAKLNNKENVTTSIKKEVILDNQLLVYPNPTTNDITIALKNNEMINNGKIEILTLQGKLMLKEKINNTHKKLDVSTLPKSTYFIKLVVDKTVVYKQIFIKQ